MIGFLDPASHARWAVRRPWLAIVAWVAILIAGLGLATQVGTVLTDDDELFVTLESDRAADLKFEKLVRESRQPAPGGGTAGANQGTGTPPGPPAGGIEEVTIIHHPTLTVDDPEFVAMVNDVAAALDANKTAIYEVQNALAVGAEEGISADGHSSILLVTVAFGRIDANLESLLATLDQFDGRDGFTVVTGGELSVDHAFDSALDDDLVRAEIYGLPAALIILVFVFGAVAAAFLPLSLGIGSIIVAVGLTTLAGQLGDISEFVINMIIMIGLAVGIDYSLLVVQRFREERARGVDRDAAIIRTGETSGRAVLFSGMAVVVALTGMYFIPHSIFRSIATGSILVVFVAVAAAISLLPAMLRLLGDRVNAIRIPRIFTMRAGGGFWTWSSHAVMARPWVSLCLSAGILLALSAGVLGLRIGESGASSLPESSHPARAFALLDRDFNAGILSPTEIAITHPEMDGPVMQAVIAELVDYLEADERFDYTEVEFNQAGDFVLITTAIAGDSQSEGAFDAVHELREEILPSALGDTGAIAYVGGDTAEVVDFDEVISGRTPIVFAFVLGLSFIILMVVFHSLVVPAKAIVMNLLSVGAAYGAMVLVFQHGWGADLLGFRQVEVIELWIPLFMFAVLFGLSMDYHVFLLSRIREHWDATGDNTTSVAEGVRTTAGLITGAALIMVAVFTGFATGELIMFQQMGFGLAVAILLDVTIVRTVLVPASMALLGRWNWYLPSWLGWLPRLELDEGPAIPSSRASAMD